MIFQIINLFAIYLLIGMVFGLVTKIFPSFIQNAFSIFQSFRKELSKLVISLYKTENNLEVNILAIFIIPFIIILTLYLTIQGYILSIPQYSGIVTFLYIAIIFLIASIVPSEEDIELISQASSVSSLVFLLKIFVAAQLLIKPDQFQYQEEVIALVLIAPISPYLNFNQSDTKFDSEMAKHLSY